MSETAYAVYNYHDGPLSGVADFQGTPHTFKNAYFDEDADRWSDVFLLRPIDPQVFAWALEYMQIRRRWSQARDRGEAPLDGHAALHQDRLRSRELAELLRGRRSVDETNATHRARGRFERVEGLGTTAQCHVQWTLLP